MSILEASGSLCSGARFSNPSFQMNMKTIYTGSQGCLLSGKSWFLQGMVNKEDRDFPVLAPSCLLQNQEDGNNLTTPLEHV